MKNPIVSIGHQLLQFDFMYDSYQKLVGGVRYRNLFVERIITENDLKKSFLDLGSGTSEVIGVFGDSHDYIGLDYSKDYLEKANSRPNSCASFQVFDFDLSKSGWSELVKTKSKSNNSLNAIALGLLHHLDDDSVHTLLREAHKTIQGDGSIYTVDPIITDDSSHIAKWFAKNDRGRYVRSKKELSQIFKKNGFEIEIEIKRKQFRIPLDTVEIAATPN